MTNVLLTSIDMMENDTARQKCLTLLSQSTCEKSHEPGMFIKYQDTTQMKILDLTQSGFSDLQQQSLHRCSLQAGKFHFEESHVDYQKN